MGYRLIAKLIGNLALVNVDNLNQFVYEKSKNIEVKFALCVVCEICNSFQSVGYIFA
jgi:hypothetical protein